MNRDVEAAYRRGYIHGYSNAMDVAGRIADKPPSPQAKAWWSRWTDFFNDILTPWRESRHSGEIVCPPPFSVED